MASGDWSAQSHHLGSQPLQRVEEDADDLACSPESLVDMFLSRGDNVPLNWAMKNTFLNPADEFGTSWAWETSSCVGLRRS